MPNEYDGETCASCLGLNTIRPQCRATGEVRDALSPVCDDFGPGWMTPACRQARALETIAALGFEAFAKYVGGRVTRSTIDSAGPE